MHGTSMGGDSMGRTDLVMSMMNETIEYFRYEHLPKKLQKVSKPYCDLAQGIRNHGPFNWENLKAMDKILAAKDCAVRAHLREDLDE
jgi:hypothetical protein